MKIYFEDSDLQELLETGKNKKYQKYAQNKLFMKKLFKVFLIFDQVDCTDDLNSYRALNYEKLKHMKENPLSSVRIIYDDPERILFKELDDGIEIIIIKLDNTHYGNKN